LEREGEADLRADAIAVRPDVADDADRFRAADAVENFVEDVPTTQIDFARRMQSRISSRM